MDNFSFPTWLKQAREKAGLSAADLAEKAGLTQPLISAYERGTRNPKRATVLFIAEAMGVDVSVALISAGFVPTGNANVREITREYAPSDEPVIHSYSGLKPTNKEAVKAIIEHFAELEKRESIGGTVATD